MWDLVGNPEDRFSHNEAHIIFVLSDSTYDLMFDCIAPAYKHDPKPKPGDDVETYLNSNNTVCLPVPGLVQFRVT